MKNRRDQAPLTANKCRRSQFQIPNPISLLVIAGGLALLVGCGPAVNAEHAAQPAITLVSQEGGSLEVVMAGTPARKSLALVTTEPARIEAIEQTPIHSKLAAYVGQVLVDYGDQVQKDQPLIQLTAPELDAEVAQKNALLGQAKAELVQAESGQKAAQAAVVTAKSAVVQAAARLEKTEADIRFWKLKCQRFSDLATGGSLNQQLVEETEQSASAAQSAHKEALAAIDSTQAGVAQSEAQAAKAAADVEAAKSRVLVAQANLAHVEALHSYLTIKAPFAGVVTSRHVDPGHFVQPATGNGTKVLVIARTDKMRIFVPIPEIKASYVDLGDKVTVEVQSLQGAEFQGKVTRTSFALASDNHSLDTIIDIDNPESRLRPGMYATARLTLDERPDALTLPSAAVVRQDKEAFCYRLVDGKAVKTALQLGIRVLDDIEIAGGLSDNDQVILNKATTLKDGQSVEVAKPPAPAK
jgi:RND family efflux transporter MFP subunit